MTIRTSDDPRIVMTLDAGGTAFEFSAMRGHKPVIRSISLPSAADNLERSLENIIAGFEGVRRQLPDPPVAISFAFPGPADYPAGIITNVGNLPAFKGGVPLGPVLQERFGIPVFINNDGDLFAYGEAIAGFLPDVNGLLEQAVEEQAAVVGAASVEAERELVQVLRQGRVIDRSLVGPKQPPLGQGGHPVHARQQPVGILATGAGRPPTCSTWTGASPRRPCPPSRTSGAA